MANPDCPCVAQYELLTKQIGPIYQKNGADYHTGEQVISFANDVWTPAGWSFRVLEHGRDELSDEMFAVVEITVRMWMHNPDGKSCQLGVVVKQDAGAHQVKRHRTTQLPLSLGDDRKSAITDGLKRCFRQLGVGLYLWAKDPEAQLPYKRTNEEEEARGQGRPTAPERATGGANGPRPTTEPPKRTFSTGEVRQRAEDRYSEILARATDEGFRAAWTIRAPSSLSDQELRRYGTQLKEHLDALEPEEKAGAAA